MATLRLTERIIAPTVETQHRLVQHKAGAARKAERDKKATRHPNSIAGEGMMDDLFEVTIQDEDELEQELPKSIYLEINDAADEVNRPPANSDSGKGAERKATLPNLVLDSLLKSPPQPEPKADVARNEASMGLNDVLSLSRQLFKDEKERKEFQTHMLAFESRAKSAGFSPEEIDKTRGQVARIITGSKETVLSDDQRKLLALSLARELADPGCIDQGQHATCNVTTVQVHMFTARPRDAATMIADVALTGKFTTTDGSEITLTKQSLTPDTEASKSPLADAARSYSSQLYQLLAVNIIWQRRDGVPGIPFKLADKGQIHYEEIATNEKGDTGERIMYRDKKGEDHAIDLKNKEISFTDSKGKKHSLKLDFIRTDSPFLTASDLCEVHKQISGVLPEQFVMVGPEIKTRSNDGIVRVENVEAMKSSLAKMSDQKQFPLIIQVHTGNEPFYTDSGAGKAGGSGGWHVVTITGYDSKTGLVAVDNSWGKTRDHIDGSKRIRVEQLFAATRSPGAKK